MSDARTTLQIMIAVQEADPNITDRDLRMCVEAMRSISHFYESELKKLVEDINRDASPLRLKMRAGFANGLLERMFTAKKTPPEEWLGPENIPGSPGYVKRLEWSKKVFRAATGEDVE